MRPRTPSSPTSSGWAGGCSPVAARLQRNPGPGPAGQVPEARRPARRRRRPASPGRQARQRQRHPAPAVPVVWQNLGFTGKGVKVGIIDGGIDYYHANFGGSGVAGRLCRRRPYGDRARHLPDGQGGRRDRPRRRRVRRRERRPGAQHPEARPRPARLLPDTAPTSPALPPARVLIDRSAYTGPYDERPTANGFLIGPGFARRRRSTPSRSSGATAGPRPT